MKKEELKVWRVRAARVLLVIELAASVWYVFGVHLWDGGMFHIALATLLKDFAEV